MVDDSTFAIISEFDNLVNVSVKILNTKNKKKIRRLKKLHNNLQNTVKNFEKMLRKSKNLLAECVEKTLSLKELHIFDDNSFPFIYNGTESKILDEVPDKNVNVIKKAPKKNKYKEINEIYKIKTPRIQVPIASKLSHISSCIFWYNGDTSHPKGLYMSPFPKLYVKIPFINVADGTKDHNRTGSIKCKYEHKNICINKKKYLSNKFDYPMRPCMYAHIGDRYTKIGSQYRSPNMPSFGNTDTLITDMKNISLKNIKIILMYAVSDILLCHMWASTNNIRTQVVFANVDICQ